jgi:hypothetical protein
VASAVTVEISEALVEEKTSAGNLVTRRRPRARKRVHRSVSRSAGERKARAPDLVLARRSRIVAKKRSQLFRHSGPPRHS